MQEFAPKFRQGLAEGEARHRLTVEGPNELPAAGTRSPWRIAIEILREPMFALLLAGGAIYVAIGDLLGGAVLLAFASLSVTISIVQEMRSERVLEALRAMTSPRALVIRDGARRRIPGREVVRGDLVVVGEGDRVPADGMLLDASELLVDESLLTGESVAVAKRPRASEDEKPAAPGGDNLPTIYSGSLVVRGSGVAEVHATGSPRGDRPYRQVSRLHRSRNTEARARDETAGARIRARRRDRQPGRGRALRRATRLVARCQPSPGLR